MSGGHYDYKYAFILDFAHDLRDDIEKNDEFSEETIASLHLCQANIEKSGLIAREVDYLFSGDSGEETFKIALYEIEMQCARDNVKNLENKIKLLREKG